MADGNTTLESFGSTGVPGAELSHPGPSNDVSGLDGNPPAQAPAGSASGQPAGQAPVAPAGPATQPPAADPAPWAGRFKSADELYKSYQEMESFKGRLGNENRNLSLQLAELRGAVSAMQQHSQASQQPQLPDMRALAAQYETGEITLSQLLEAQRQVTNAELQRDFNARLNETVTGFKKEAEVQKYREKFIADNPGYVDAYTSGALDRWIQQGYSGEEAWASYRAETLQAQLNELNEKAKQQQQQALEQGRQEGQRLQGAKAAPAATLGGGPGSGLRTGQQLPHGQMTNAQRIEAGKLALARLRGTAA